jgi:MarR family transcriptional regulator, transcriptional regulator for hemolysin
MISTPEDIVQESPDMATQPSAEPPVTEFAGQFFFRLWRATHTRTAEELASVGLTPALFALLNVIGARKGAIQQELGSALGIDRSTMVSLIDQLESGGLATRRPSATDRRAREIAITPKGRRLLQRARGLIARVEDEVLAGLTEEERHELLVLLRRALDSAPAQPLWSAAEGD